MGRMKAKPIRRQQTRLESLKDQWEKKQAQEAAELQRRLKQEFLERRAA